MAADNYSDVVQALAKQIVDTCMQSMRKNIQGLMTGVTINAEQIEGEVTNVNTNNLIVDPANITGLNEYVAGLVSSARIDVSQIARLDPDTGELYLDNVHFGDAQIEDLEARFAQIWSADIYLADIQTALVDALHANFAQIADAQIQNATIQSAQITDLTTAAANIAKAEIGQAEIDFAQIKALSAKDVIIEKGLGGKLYIADLAVTEANMVSLTVGELIVKGQDGGFYSVSIDEDGKVVADKKLVAGNDLEDLSITGGKIANGTINGDTKIIESSITAKTLNVQDIFAENAMVLKLIAQNINVDELFANEAFINKLNATDIVSNTYLKLALDKLYEDTMQEVSIMLSDESIISTVTGSKTFSDILDERTRITYTVTYYIGDSGTEPPGDQAGWNAEMPEPGYGDYLWTKTVTSYGNGQPDTVLYYVSRFGERAADGIVLKLSSDSGTSYHEPTGTMTLTADVYAGGVLLSQADVNVLGCIHWFKNGVRIRSSALDNWHQLTIDLATVGEHAVYTATLMG